MIQRRALALLTLVLALAWLAPWAPPPAPRAQGVEVFLNVTGGGSKKLNIAIPEFTVVSGTDPQGTAKLLAAVAGNDLTFSGLFSVVTATGAIPPNNPTALKESWSAFAAAGAHAGVHGLLALLDRVTLREIMIKEVVTVTPDRSIPEAARLLVEHRIGALPVVEDGRLVGILTETDVLNAYLSLGDVSEIAPQPCWMADAARY